MNKSHERTTAGHIVWHEHDRACRRQVCSIACLGAGIGLAETRTCLECFAGCWEQVHLPALLAAAVGAGDGLRAMAYPAPVYHGLGAFGLLPVANAFDWSTPQTVGMLSSFERVLCCRANALLEECPGLVQALARSRIGASMLESIADPTRVNARTLRGTKTVTQLAAGHTLQAAAETLQEIEMSTCSRYYASPMQLTFSRAGGERQTSEVQHEADSQATAQVMRRWASPVARPAWEDTV